MLFAKNINDKKWSEISFNEVRKEVAYLHITFTVTCLPKADLLDTIYCASRISNDIVSLHSIYHFRILFSGRRRTTKRATRDLKSPEPIEKTSCSLLGQRESGEKDIEQHLAD